LVKDIAIDATRLLPRDIDEPKYTGILYVREKEAIDQMKNNFEANWEHLSQKNLLKFHTYESEQG
jgi:hypothetical protein